MKTTMLFAVILLAILALSCSDRPLPVASAPEPVQKVRPLSVTYACGNLHFPGITETSGIAFQDCNSTTDVTEDADYVALKWSQYVTDPTGGSTLNDNSILCGPPLRSIGTPGYSVSGAIATISWGFIFCHQYRVTRTVDGVITLNQFVNNKTDQGIPPHTTFDDTWYGTQLHSAVTYTIHCSNFGTDLDADFPPVSVTLPARGINGPTCIYVPAKNKGSVTCTWTSQVSGTSYQWKMDGFVVGTGSSYSASYHYTGYNNDFNHTLTLTVGGQTVSINVLEDAYPYQNGDPNI